MDGPAMTLDEWIDRAHWLERVLWQWGDDHLEDAYSVYLANHTAATTTPHAYPGACQRASAPACKSVG